MYQFPQKFSKSDTFQKSKKKTNFKPTQLYNIYILIK